MKNQILAIIVISILPLLSFSQESARVLFIGNSYTYVNDLPTMLSNIASSFGDQVTHDSQTPGGATFQAHTQNAATWTKINSQNWDVVVLQAQSQEPSFPDDQVNNGTLPFAKQLADSVYANHFCSEVMMYMTWGRKNGDPQWAPISTFNGMNERLRSAYLRMADSVQGSVSPVGSAWKYVRENYPSIELYNPDESHPSIAGTYLAACTFYASIFRKSPVGSSFISSLDPVDAANLQLAAATTVLDSLAFFNLRPIEEHTKANFSVVQNDPEIQFVNQSTKALNYQWDFGDGTTSTLKHPTHTYVSNGNFTVTLVAESPCDTDTKAAEYIINLASLDQGSSPSFQFKSLAPGKYVLTTVRTLSNVFITTLDGKKLNMHSDSEMHFPIDLTNYSNGIYLLNFSVENENFQIRLVK